jgi:hypothetical protein
MSKFCPTFCPTLQPYAINSIVVQNFDFYLSKQLNENNKDQKLVK